MINEQLKEIRERRKYYENHPEIVEAIIKKGDEKAREEAEKVLKKIRKAVGMYQN